MSSADPFKQVEDHYFSLRGQLDAKRITQEQYEAALKELMVQDAQGRYWMLGAQSGAWYVYDGQQWVQDTPPGYSSPASAFAPTPPAPAVAPVYAPPPAAPASRAPQLPLLIAGVAFALLLIVGGFYLLTRQNSSAVVQYITATVPPSVNAPATATAPLPTATALIAIATVPPPPTAEPAVRPSAMPSIAPATQAPPTAPQLPPTATNMAPATPTVALPTSAPVVRPSATNVAPATLTVALSTNTPAPSYPPGVYVTQIRTDPAQPKRGQGIAFTVTFVNTTGVGQIYNWLVQIYDPDKKNSRFGETLVQPITVPPGTTQFMTANNWSIGNAGGCKDFFAQAERQNEDKTRIAFTAPEGYILSYSFQVCPP